MARRPGRRVLDTSSDDDHFQVLMSPNTQREYNAIKTMEAHFPCNVLLLLQTNNLIERSRKCQRRRLGDKRSWTPFSAELQRHPSK